MIFYYAHVLVFFLSLFPLFNWSTNPFLLSPSSLGRCTITWLTSLNFSQAHHHHQFKLSFKSLSHSLYLYLRVFFFLLETIIESVEIKQQPCLNQKKNDIQIGNQFQSHVSQGLGSVDSGKVDQVWQDG